jgi:hypothetical protein
VLERGRLRVRLRVSVEGQGIQSAYLPERELAALLPRTLLLGNGAPPPRELLSTLQPILNRRIRGRTVRLWRWQEREYAAFLPWRSVRFVESADDRGAGSAPGRG